MGKGSYVTQVPLTIPSCVGWMDAADTSTSNITSSGGAVSQIANKANSQIPFVQAAGADQPTTGIRTINGLNALDFDGSTEYLSANGLAGLFTGSDKSMTVFSVCQSDAPSGGTQQSIWGLGYSSTTNPIMYQYYLSSTNGITRRDDAGTIVTISPAIISGVNVNAIVFSGTTVSSYTNATTNASGSAMDVGNITVDRFAIGALLRPTAGQFFNGVISEVIIYNTALTDEQRISIQRYLGNKWGISVA